MYSLTNSRVPKQQLSIDASIVCEWAAYLAAKKDGELKAVMKEMC